jgi:hypothetical protein
MQGIRSAGEGIDGPDPRAPDRLTTPSAHTDEK